MQTEHRTPNLTLTTSPSAEIDADVLVLPIFDEPIDDEPALDAATGGEISRARRTGECSTALYETFSTAILDTGWRTRRLLLVGLGSRGQLTRDRWRRFATVAGLTARRRRLTRPALMLCTGAGVAQEDAVQAIAEGLVLANFDGASRKTTGPARSWLSDAQIRVPERTPGHDAARARGVVLGECTNQARALANEPGNSLTPSVLATRALELAVAAGLGAEVLDEHRIAELGMGLLLGVAQGSQEPPRLIVLRHDPPDAVPGVLLGLVGKGVTFDTGGISIKPADNMDKMKDDMSGGAAVLAAMAAIARLGAPVRCIGVVPAAENMPGSRAVKPGDVLTSAAGTTVEVLNTDAEGRLLLGDALWYARQQGATHLVDVATLTGACVVALGKTTSGLFGTPDAWVNAVRDASEAAGDRSWPLPIFDDYRDQLKSEIADITNTGGRPAGAITGALFVKEFSGGLPWVHMDIAGTAWAEEARPYQPKGATGVGVRTLVELALAAGRWGADR